MNQNRILLLCISLFLSACSSTERYLVTLGGYCDDAVYMARVRDDGTLDPWTTEADYPLVFGAQGTEVVDGVIISTGGFVAADGGPTDATYTARIEHGSIRRWVPAPRLPSAVFTNTLVADGSTLYSMGSWAPAADAVFTAQIDGDGQVGEWSQAPSLPAPRDFAGVVLGSSFVWLIGGDAGALQPRTEVFYAPLEKGKIGSWNTTSALPEPGRFGHGVVLHNNRIFILGGGHKTGPTDSVLFADVAPDGQLGPWTETTPLPSARWFIGATSSRGMLYAVAGGNEDGATDSAWVAPFTADGLGPFTTLENMPGGLQDNRAVIVEVR